jgi:hypothetical protein
VNVKNEVMTIEQRFKSFFKPEDRKRGEEIHAMGLVTVTRVSETEVLAYVKASTSLKITFSAADIASSSFSSNCSCASSKKGILCQHIWATLLKLGERDPDFLDSKRVIERSAKAIESSQSPYLTKQKEFKKQQYELQKQRAKLQRKEKKQSERPSKPTFVPKSVEQARCYFMENGFPIELPLNEEYLKNAKKILARVFHPDKGGSHEESVLLNLNFDILMQYSR